MELVYQEFITRLAISVESERIVIDKAKMLAYGTDASFYRLTPKVVVRLKSLDEVIYTLKICSELDIPCTFRAAGTSLSGQAVSDSVLIALTDDWRGHKILDGGDRICLQPGVIGSDANRYLLPFGRKIGPDPASINSCKIGGIAANNASGMCCGTAQNTYQTLDDMTLVFADGFVLNTADETSVSVFKNQKRDLIKGVESLCDTVRSNLALEARIRHKYRLKNTTGYALNSLVDYCDPIDVIKHLMVGSEGTLGFIAEITYKTVVEHAYKASALIVFNDIEQACRAVSALASEPVAAVEMMDGRAMASVADKAGMPAFIKRLDLEACALLIETRASNKAQLLAQCEQVKETLLPFFVIDSIDFTSRADTLAMLWGIRKGMFPAVGAVREVGTSVIIEDVAFPVELLAAGVRDLQQLFNQFKYDEAIIFGHALEGNLHFVFTQGFESEDEIERYGDFMDAVAELVAVKYQGSLKAEHGTGRNMAPYVELEWGQDAYRLMQEVKRLFDPRGILNPGVILNEDSQCHIKHLKPMPKADELVDRCIECGFCEPVCPSRTLTLSPRQRIVLYRELQRREAAGEREEVKALAKVFEYQGLDTCAATGLCAERCPVGINTGELVKKLRRAKYQKFTPIARWTVEHFDTTTKMVKFGLGANQQAQKILGDKVVGNLVNGLRSLTQGATPAWTPQYPAVNRHKPASFSARSERVELATEPPLQKVVYMPSCASRTMGQQLGNREQRSLTQVTESLLQKAGIAVIVPLALNEQCCGMPYDSKGMTEVADKKSKQLEERLWQASEQGRWPVLMDTSPCAKRSIEQFTKPIEVFEPVGFAHRYLLKHLHITPTDEAVTLHVTCSSRRMGLENTMLELAKVCTPNVIVPEHIQCCGWAGDKGFTTPELNMAALTSLKKQLPAECQRGFSNSRTCEIGLSHHGGIPYQSIFYLLDEVSTEKGE
ncbi:FAD-binding and (Fe-S)-binding domain-containing protein [Shewanella nanhaiensis]|uniref:D-lactate dehydrogenase (cytochrome) n=1 Tax=Shewanella nanhaiensis TaxID=2864872 RepID=A0ABS7E031_9GAMM|nr:FAD-binding and (Fe-S)-binding domain-containing protein [Shewanella nanhaiensis]MBW8182974.1 FAD-binding oxidoreductase [Shewanella nanhaiensis]